jgi:hypothetical protein
MIRVEGLHRSYENMVLTLVFFDRDDEGDRFALLANLPSVTEYHVDEHGDSHVYHFFLAGVSEDGAEEEESLTSAEATIAEGSQGSAR